MKTASNKTARRARKKLGKPQWERRHTLIHGNEVVGEIALGTRGTWDGIYRWRVGNVAGETVSLEDAKREAETSLALQRAQMPLPLTGTGAGSNE